MDLYSSNPFWSGINCIIKPATMGSDLKLNLTGESLGAEVKHVSELFPLWDKEAGCIELG